MFSLFCLVLAAVTPPEPPAPTAEVAPASAEDPADRESAGTAWRIRFDLARRALDDGRFGEAAAAFELLAAEAPSVIDAARAEALAEVAGRWATRGLVLVDGRDQAGDDAARRVNRRTTGELAVLYIDAVLYGIGTGVWLAVQTDPDSASGAILPALGFAGAAAGGVYLADSMDGFGYGVPRSVSAGLRIGLMEGAVWTAWNQAHARAGDEWSSELASTVVWGVSTVGAAAGAIVGKVAGATPGAASFVESGAFWGGLVGGLTGATFAPDTDEGDDVFLLTGALSLNAAAGTAAWFASDIAPSSARVRFLDLGGVSGGLLFGGLYLAIADLDEDARRGFTAVTATGVLGGLVTAWILTRGMPRDTFADADEPEVRVGFGTTPEGGAGLQVGGTF